MSLFVPWVELVAPHPPAELTAGIPLYHRVSSVDACMGGQV